MSWSQSHGHNGRKYRMVPQHSVRFELAWATIMNDTIEAIEHRLGSDLLC